ncbi:hypothetical protein ZWY2020_060076 [Hordeum vulgare]|nr:hypothetical protein ZWY2020_060076 [Hordeum vulgare]
MSPPVVPLHRPARFNTLRHVHLLPRHSHLLSPRIIHMWDSTIISKDFLSTSEPILIFFLPLSRIGEFMPRRSIWKGSFVNAFQFRIKKNRESLMSRKIWSRRSSISPEFVDCSVLIYNGKTPVRCKITEGKVGHKFGEFAFTRRRRPYRTNRGKRKK